MVEEKPEILFTPKYVELIKQARKDNEDHRDENIYYHPKESKNRPVKKIIDLKSDSCLCEVNNKSGRGSPEHWLEAYIIKITKQPDWEFKYLIKPEQNSSEPKQNSGEQGQGLRFLSSQLKFRKHSALKINGKYHLTTDVLFYDANNKTLVIWELKANRNSISEAKRELDIYVEELKRLFIRDEKENACEAFGRFVVEKVAGYIVCPRRESNPDEKKGKKAVDKGAYGLYEFYCPDLIIDHGKLIKPWKIHNTMGGKMEIKFKLQNPKS